jgi:HEAT repeat protein
VEGLQNPLGQNERRMSAQALSVLGPNAKKALPALLVALKDPDQMVRVDAAGAIWKIEKKTATALPVLTATLSDSVDMGGKPRAIHYLNLMGPDAKRAFPTLLAFWEKSDVAHTKKSAATALKAIDPEAAAKVGVK